MDNVFEKQINLSVETLTLKVVTIRFTILIFFSFEMNIVESHPQHFEMNKE